MTALLTIAISTTGQRLAALEGANLPHRADTNYLILWQSSGHVPESIAPLVAREDVTLHWLAEQTGVAQSRNAAITLTDTPFLLFADDDQKFTPAGWTELLAYFTANSKIDFLCARLRAPDGAWRKNYGPPHVRAVRKWNCLKVGTPELALRVATMKDATFDRDFGAGSDQPLGDEAVFICDALSAGLKGQHVVIEVGAHPAASSGMTFDKTSHTARTAVLRRCFGHAAPLVRIVFAIKHRRHFPDRSSWFRFVFGKSEAGQDGSISSPS